MTPHPTCRECGAPATFTVAVRYSFGVEYPKQVCTRCAPPESSCVGGWLDFWGAGRDADVTRRLDVDRTQRGAA